MSINQNYPTIKPSLNLDFANTKTLDPRITFSRASAATYYDALGVLRTAASGVPRFDHDPATLVSKGLLVEEQRTNLLTYSEQFDNAAWNSLTGVSITPNTDVSPNSLTTAATLTHVSSSTLFGRTPVSVSAGSVLVYSLFAKKGNASFIRLRINSGADTCACWFNLDTGVAASNTAGSGNVLFSNKNSFALGNGWYRFSLVVSTTAITTVDLTCAASQADNGASAAGNTVILWGAQLEQGAFPTSYIQTTSAQATRAADLASITGTNFSSWYRQSEGTMVTVFSASSLPADSSSFGRVWELNAGVTNVDSTSLLINNGWTPDRVALLSYNASVLQVDTSGQASGFIGLPVTQAKHSVAYKKDDYAIVWNGGSVVLDTSATVPATTQLEIGKYATSSQLNGHIARITYYPKRLTNTQLQYLTK